VGKTRRLRSTIIHNCHNPVWIERANVYVADEAEDLTLEVKVRWWRVRPVWRCSSAVPRATAACLRTHTRSQHHRVVALCAVGPQDADVVGAELLGCATIPVDAIAGGQPYDAWLALTDKAGTAMGYTEKRSKQFTQARLHVSITYHPVGAQTEVCVCGVCVLCVGGSGHAGRCRSRPCMPRQHVHTHLPAPHPCLARSRRAPRA
jgi:hypothetical protein